MSHTFPNRKYTKNLTFGLNPNLCSTIQCQYVLPALTIRKPAFCSLGVCLCGFVNILKINFLAPYTANCLIFAVKRPLGCQYYCKILLPLINIAQRFFLDDSVLLFNIILCSWARTRKYLEWYWCWFCGHCFGTLFKLLAPEFGI